MIPDFGALLDITRFTRSNSVTTVLFFHQRWDFDNAEFRPIHFEEVMIDHLEIESTTILIESRSGKMQIAEYGIPEPPNGKNMPKDIIVNNLFLKIFFFF